ncbi:unnamed protein product, partial [marine sediment metagenome]
AGSKTDTVYDIGEADKRFRSGYFTEAVHIDGTSLNHNYIQSDGNTNSWSFIIGNSTTSVMNELGFGVTQGKFVHFNILTGTDYMVSDSAGSIGFYLENSQSTILKSNGLNKTWWINTKIVTSVTAASIAFGDINGDEQDQVMIFYRGSDTNVNNTISMVPQFAGTYFRIHFTINLFNHKCRECIIFINRIPPEPDTHIISCLAKRDSKM